MGEKKTVFSPCFPVFLSSAEHARTKNDNKHRRRNGSPFLLLQHAICQNARENIRGNVHCPLERESRNAEAAEIPGSRHRHRSRYRDRDRDR